MLNLRCTICCDFQHFGVADFGPGPTPGRARHQFYRRGFTEPPISADGEKEEESNRHSSIRRPPRAVASAQR